MANNSNKVPRSLLVSFFREATRALDSSQIKDPLTLPECRSLIMEKQSSCLAEVVAEHNAKHPQYSLAVPQVQASLSSLSDSYREDKAIVQAMEKMTDAARKALARIVLTSECLRTGTISLNKINPQEAASRSEPLKTSRMTRSETLEFCALCQATIRIESVQSHMRDPKERLLETLPSNPGDNQEWQPGMTPPIKRVENLQRLLLQAMGYDADMGLPELARQVKLGGNDDVELVEIIQQTTDQLMEALFATHKNTTKDELLSDQGEGGVTRVLSVQHSEKLVQMGGGEAHDPEASSIGAPVSQSMRSDTTSSDQLQMAQKAAALRDSLVNELLSMTEENRSNTLQQAEQALEVFQRRAMEIPPGPERIEFLRNMDATTQKLLAMHRIWQEHQKSGN